jgi:hypothetical protein
LASSTPRKLYAGTFDGFFITTDGGSSWTAARDGFIDRHRVNAIVVDPRGNGRVYASTDKGVRADEPSLHDPGPRQATGEVRFYSSDGCGGADTTSFRPEVKHPKPE